MKIVQQLVKLRPATPKWLTFDKKQFFTYQSKKKKQHSIHPTIDIFTVAGGVMKYETPSGFVVTI